MSTHDYIVDNQNGANFRSDLNNALAAIVSNNSSATAPTTTYAFMLWADTANDILKQRNGADSAWISILTLSTGAPLAGMSDIVDDTTPQLGGDLDFQTYKATSFTSTGIDDNATSTAITITSDGRGLSQFTAKAWGKFNGTGTPAYADSHNCSSLTDVGTGRYTINFTNSMANTNYSKVVDCRDTNHSSTLVVAHSSDAYGTGSFQVLLQHIGASSGAADEQDVHFIVFGD